MNTDKIYPYLTLGLFNPEWEEITIAIGHGVYATLFEDRETENGIVHRTVTPEQVQETGLTAEELHSVAIENLSSFAREDPSLSIKMVGEPGADTTNFLLFSGHPRAAACLRLPGLFSLASQHLLTDDLCACIPQRESLIVMPTRNSEYRVGILGRVREIEADARKPITFELFRVAESGITHSLAPNSCSSKAVLRLFWFYSMPYGQRVELAQSLRMAHREHPGRMESGC